MAQRAGSCWRLRREANERIAARAGVSKVTVLPWRAAVASGDVHVLDRSGTGRQVTDVVGLYLAPPENAIVLVIDEKPQIQALNRNRAGVADAAAVTRETHPRLRPAWHQHLVRRPGDRHRQGHRRLQTTAPPSGVPGVPQTGDPGLLRPASCIW